MNLTNKIYVYYILLYRLCLLDSLEFSTDFFHNDLEFHHGKVLKTFVTYFWFEINDYLQ